MSSILLKTKLHIPSVRPNLMPRPRLIERLNEGLTGRLTLLSAPAGFGKTTLLSEWVNQSEIPVAWVSLDEGDNDLARFLAYLIAALQTLQADMGETALAVLQSPQLPPVESILTLLINEIVEKSTAFALILDDYHVIEAAKPIHNFVTFLLDHLPMRRHLIIATRSVPPLPLSRLRGRGLMTEIHADELRFTVEEAATFLNEIMGLHLSGADVSALEARTEGWIAGLQLAALSMQGRRPEDITSFIDTFTGGHRYILDYLADEVLQQRPQGTKDFLLQTSILSRLSGPLCDAITGQSDGQAKLERLEQSNLFIVPLDDERRWFRYHHLFADFLRDRLQQNPPPLSPPIGEKKGGVVSELHRRASAWYEMNGLTEESLEHALAAEDFEQATRLVEQMADRVSISSPRRVLNWLKALPPDLVRTQPKLSTVYGLTLVSIGQLDAAEPYLQDAERAMGIVPGGSSATITEASAPDKPQFQEYLGQIVAIRAIAACYRGDASGAIELSHQALERISEDDLHWRSLMAINIALNLAAVTRSIHEMAEAGRVLAEAARVSRAAGDIYTALFAISKLGDLHKLQGHLHLATRAYREAIDLTAKQGQDRQLPAVNKAYVGLGVLLYEWNDLEAATHYLTRGIEFAESGGDLDGLAGGYVALVRLYHAQGNTDDATAMVQKVKALAQTSKVTLIEARAAVAQVRLWLALGNVAPAARWAQTCGLGVGDEIGYHREDEHTTLARVFIAENKPEEALKLLTWLEGVTEQAGLTGLVIESLMLQAQALQMKEEMDQAMAALEKALTLAEPEGYIRLFVDAGAPMAKLLRQAASRGITILHYVGKLLAAFGEPITDVTQPIQETRPDVEPLLEPLSERELQVLRLIAAGLSTQEIARELVIAVSTVNSHIKNVYGKLDVHSRIQAVERARDLNLLSS